MARKRKALTLIEYFQSLSKKKNHKYGNITLNFKEEDMPEMDKMIETILSHAERVRIPSPTSLKSFDFLNQMKKLVKLSLTEAKLTEIHPGILEMNQLEELSLKRNCITTIPSNFFEKLPNLKNLDLEYNLLSGPFPRKDSTGSMKNLEGLYLANNEITELTDMVKECPLTTLSIAKSKLVQLPSFIWECKTLTYLSYWGNKSTMKDSVPSSIKNLKNLETLDFGVNNICEVDWDAIQTLKNLRRLKYAKNDCLVPNHFDFKVFSQLKELDIRLNPRQVHFHTCLHNEQLAIHFPKLKLFRHSFADEILPSLYLGDIGAAANEAYLKTIHIKRVLNCCALDDTCIYKHQGIHYKNLVLVDEPHQDLLKVMDDAVYFIHQAISKQNTILVHCMAGKSRSVSMIIAYMMKYLGKSLAESLELLQQRRCGGVDPNPGFMNQLKAYEKDIQSNKK